MARITENIINVKLDTLNMITRPKNGKYAWVGDACGYALVFRYENTGIKRISETVRTMGQLASIIDAVINVYYLQTA